MILIRELVLISMKFNISFRGKHINGVDNKICDAISRKQWTRFQVLAPDSNRLPARVPESFLGLLSEVK